MPNNIVVKQAKKLGFFCQINEEKKYEIFSKIPTKNWKLTESESKWILSVNNVPQLSLDRDTAIAFLVERDREQ